jgi:hypothetical protein
VTPEIEVIESVNEQIKRNKQAIINSLVKPLRDFKKYEILSKVKTEIEEDEKCTFRPKINNKPPRPNT